MHNDAVSRSVIPTALRAVVGVTARVTVGVTLSMALLACDSDPPAKPRPPAPTIGSASSGGGDPAPTGPAPAAASPPIFTDVSAAWGLDWRHDAGTDGTYPLASMLGSGVAVFDADGDGLLDLYFANAGTSPESGAKNRFYRQVERGRLVEQTDESGLGDERFSIGLAAADIDNDGDIDVYVTNWGRDTLYLNDGGGRFTDVTEAAGLANDVRMSSSVALFDHDRDGLLDIFALRYVVPDPLRVCGGTRDARDFCGPKSYLYETDSLYRNRGDGTFEDVSKATGLADRDAPGLGLEIHDFDGDGRPDIYVANDGMANFLWVNQPDGTLLEDGVSMGVAYNGQGAAESSMGIAMGDLDGDGADELFVSHLEGETNTLYRRTAGDAGSGFLDVSGRGGVAAASLSVTGWGAAMIDVDNDGDLDLVHTNGATRRRAEPLPSDVPAPWNDYAEPGMLLLNDGTGRLTSDEGAAGGLGSVVDCGRALAAADLDGDGDLDLVCTYVGGRARIFANTGANDGHWLLVRVAGAGGDVVGAVIELEAAGRTYVREVDRGASYTSSTSSEAHFGLAAADEITSLRVTWPNGTVEAFPVAGVDRIVTVARGKGTR